MLFHILVRLSTTSRSNSSISMPKMSLRRILPWMWCFLITSECYNTKNRGEDGSKLIRIGGDIIFGGIFPMHEQVSFFTQDVSVLAYFLLMTNFSLTLKLKSFLATYVRFATLSYAPNFRN